MEAESSLSLREDPYVGPRAQLPMRSKSEIENKLAPRVPSSFIHNKESSPSHLTNQKHPVILEKDGFGNQIEITKRSLRDVNKLFFNCNFIM